MQNLEDIEALLSIACHVGFVMDSNFLGPLGPQAKV
jgi:hypothetical protein